MLFDLILSAFLPSCAFLLHLYLCKANSKRGCYVTDSPAQKRPVVSLTEEETRSTISVFAIFKRVRDRHKDYINKVVLPSEGIGGGA